MSKPFYLIAIAVAGLAAITPGFAAVDRDLNADRYFAARLAEFEDRDADALANYLLMFKLDATSLALAERLYHNAMLQGDIPSAIKAVRALELHNAADATAPLLLFADAFKRRDWQNADIAIAELEAKSNFGFISPVLRGWVNVAQGKPHGFDSIAARKNPMLGYYSSDQLVYLELASGNLNTAKPLLINFRNVESNFARDLIIRAAPVYAANRDADFARALLINNVEQEYSGELLNPNKNRKEQLQPLQGLSALFSRFSSALNEQNVPEQALITARIAYWLDAQSETSKLALSKALFAMGRRKPAFEMLRKISSASPYGPQAVTEEISNLSSMDRGQDALTLAQAEIRRHPNSSRALSQLAQAFEQQGNYVQTVQIYKSLVSLSEKSNAPPRRQALNLLYLATANDKNGDWIQARRLLDQANQLDPNNPYILNYLGFTLLERREDIPAALEIVKRAYQLAPDSAAIADSLGWGYYLNGNYKQAITFLEQAVKQSPNDVTINEHLGDAYWQYGKRVHARYAWMTAAHKASDSEKLRLQKKIDFGLYLVNPDVAL